MPVVERLAFDRECCTLTLFSLKGRFRPSIPLNPQGKGVMRAKKPVEANLFIYRHSPAHGAFVVVGRGIIRKEGSMATEIIPTRHECYEELTRLKLLYNEEHERADKAQQALDLATQSLIDKERENQRLREALEWYANEQNYTWSGVPGHWEEKQYHRNSKPVSIPIPDMGQRAREALKEG